MCLKCLYRHILPVASYQSRESLVSVSYTTIHSMICVITEIYHGSQVVWNHFDYGDKIRQYLTLPGLVSNILQKVYIIYWPLPQTCPKPLPKPIMSLITDIFLCYCGKLYYPSASFSKYFSIIMRERLLPWALVIMNAVLKRKLAWWPVYTIPSLLVWSANSISGGKR